MYMNRNRSVNIVFICSSLVFNISVSALYIATKLGETVIMQVCGGIVISLMVPFTITLLGYIRAKGEKKTIISNVSILCYLFLELLLDYILKIPFREILSIHIPYNIAFMAAMFSMIGVSFDKNRRMGFVVTIAFLMLIGCLTYYLLPF